MKLYLVQHGNANPVEVDPEKGLSDKGKADVEVVGQFLERAGVTVADIFHSPKARAKQTAEILSDFVDGQSMHERADIQPMDDVSPVKADIESRDNDMMIVSHMPFVDKLSSALLTGSEMKGVVQFEQSGVLAMERAEGGWRVLWMVIPSLLTK